MDKPKKLVCENCGGAIDRRTMICPYCDTQYEQSPDGLLKPIHFVPDIPGVHHFSFAVKVDLMRFCNDPEGARRYAMDKISNHLAKMLLERMELEVTDSYIDFTKIFRGRIRVFDPSLEV